MTTFDFDSLIVPTTAAQWRSSIYSVLAIQGVDTTNWKTGAVVRALITAFSIILSALSIFVSLIAKSGFLATAEGEWLEWLAEKLYGTIRVQATFATTTLTLTNSGGGLYILDIGDLIVKNTNTDALYRNTAAVTINPSSTATVEISAIEAGSANSALAGEITSLVTSLPGVACTNDSPAVGTDAEELSALKIRAGESLGAASPNGPQDAYNYFAKSAVDPNGVNYGIIETQVVPSGYGDLTVYLRSASGDVPTPTVEAIDEIFQRNCVPIPVTVDTESCFPVPIDLIFTVWIPASAGYTEQAVKDAIQQTFTDFLLSYPIAGRIAGVDQGLFLSEISAVIGRAVDAAGNKLPIFRVEIADPVGTHIAYSDGDVAVPGTLTATVVFT